MKETHYYIKNNSFTKPFVAAVICDLHSTPPNNAIEILQKTKPDMIFAPGDIFESLSTFKAAPFKRGLTLLSAAAATAPTFYSLGNHETGGIKSWSRKWINLNLEKGIAHDSIHAIKNTGCTYLDDEFVLKNGIAVGGLTSGLINEGQLPNLGFLDRFTALDMPKILLCHHPEYIKTHLADKKIDLIVSGHAHGGQWRIFGRGLFSPGQGIFPKYTKGVHKNRFVISTGLQKGGIPRFFNPPEVVIIHMN